MKLATYQDGSRDGQLVVVSRDLASAHYATGIATRLQAVLDDWNYLSPQLQALSGELDTGRARHAFAFDASRCMAPLPRAFCHAEGVPETSPETPAQDASRSGRPGLVRLSGGGLLGARDPVTLPSAELDADFQAGLAVVTGDVAAGCPPEQALEGVRLVTLANGWTLRRLAGHGLAFHARPATAFAPVAVTVDELGPAWSGGRLQGRLQVGWNGRTVGMCDTAADMALDFGELIARLARTCALPAGTVCGSGRLGGDPAGRAAPAGPALPPRRARKPAQEAAPPDLPRGYASIADKRASELRLDGVARTGFVQAHDTVQVEMKGRDGWSIFGAIAQEVTIVRPPGGDVRSQGRLALQEPSV